MYTKLTLVSLSNLPSNFIQSFSSSNLLSTRNDLTDQTSLIMQDVHQVGACGRGLKVKSKVIPITGHDTGDVDAGVHIFAATALGIGSVASHTLRGLYPQESPGTHFTGG